jgi:hypothetical protein
VAGEAGGMAVQLSNRQRREKEKKRKYCERKAGPVDESAKIASHWMTRAERNRTYPSREHVKERDAENKRKKRQSKKSEMVVDSVMCSDCIDMATKCAEWDRTYKSKEHVKERHAEGEGN